jgi:hypothetical protein
MADIPLARHELLTSGYAFGLIQTTRGCPLNCSFCSVTSFNGRDYRRRRIEGVVEHFKSIQEKRVLVVDDNLIGTRPEHIARAKALFRAMIQAKLRKKWIAQVTINMAEDEELLVLAAKAGCCAISPLGAKGRRSAGHTGGQILQLLTEDHCQPGELLDECKNCQVVPLHVACTYLARRLQVAEHQSTISLHHLWWSIASRLLGVAVIRQCR